MLNELVGYLAVAGDDAAEGTLGIASEGAVVGGGDVLGHGGAAGVLVLENHARRLVELAHEIPGGIRIQVVVVRKRLTLNLLGAHERMLGAAKLGKLVGEAVDGGRLLRILAVAQVVGLLEPHAKLVGKVALGLGVALLGIELVRKPGGDGSVVERGGLVDLELQLATGGERGGAIVGTHLVEDAVVVLRVNHHGHARGVLGGGAQHGGTADVDVLDGVRVRDVGLGNGLLELIEVDDHEVDHADAVLGRLGHVLGVVAAGEQAAVHLGVQRLDAAVHHLGKARVLLDGHHLHAGLGQHARRAAGRDDLDAKLVLQRLHELDDTGLVRDRDERALDGTICHGTSSNDACTCGSGLRGRGLRVAGKGPGQRLRIRFELPAPYCGASATDCGRRAVLALLWRKTGPSG